MKNTLSRLLAVLPLGLLLAGCADSGGEKTTANVAEPPTKGSQNVVSESIVEDESAENKSIESAVDAEKLLADTLAKAKTQNKRVFVHLGAPWCGWCKVLEQFLDQNAALFADDYLVLKIDIESMQHGEEVQKKLRGDRNDGIPWITILDGNGKELVTSDGPKGNIGCPIAEDEQAFFLTMIEKTTQHAPADRIAAIAKALDEFAKKRAD